MAVLVVREAAVAMRYRHSLAVAVVDRGGDVDGDAGA
jgi:hypothetical protein